MNPGYLLMVEICRVYVDRQVDVWWSGGREQTRLGGEMGDGWGEGIEVRDGGGQKGVFFFDEENFLRVIGKWDCVVENRADLGG